MRQVLSDVRVVELARGVAGAFCGKAFADLGADVVKVELPVGDLLRGQGSWPHYGTNRRRVVADPSTTVGRAAVAELVARADLVIEAVGAAEQGSGDLREWGLDRDVMRTEHPALVVVCISGYGESGPYAGRPWSDVTAEAFSGTLLMQGHPRGPVKLPASVGLCAVGHTAALGALAAVMRAEASGVGAFVDCAAYEALAAVPIRTGAQLSYSYIRDAALEPRPVMSGTTLFPTGVFPCADGYVAMMSTPQQLQEMLSVLDDDALRDAFAHPDALERVETREALDLALYPWLAEHTRAEITAAAQAAGWPLAGVHSPDEVLEADHPHQRGFWVRVGDAELGKVLIPGPPYRHAEGGWQLRREAPDSGEASASTGAAFPSVTEDARPAGDPALADRPPLAGVRVLDLTVVWSGPYLTALLADLGAEVIRVENPSVFPPTTKGYVPRVHGAWVNAGPTFAPPAPGRPDRSFNRASWNNSVSRNKRSITLDTRTDEGRELFLRLVEHADVLVENLKLHTLHQMGIHESEVLERNLRMIVLRLPPAGLTGEWAHYTGFGAQFDGLTGLAWICGQRGVDLVETPATTHMDAVTGPAGAFAVCAALRYREATGRGQLVELAQCENVLSQLGDVFVAVQRGARPGKDGNRDPWRAPQGTYRCADGWVAVSVADDEQWQALCRVAGASVLDADPRHRDLAGRLEHHDEIDAALGAWTATLPADQVADALTAAGVAAAAVLDAARFARDPQVLARGYLRAAPSLDVGTHDHIGHAFTGLPLAWGRGSPALGEDNEYVYREVMGLDEAGYCDLVERRVATEDYLDASGQPY